MKARVRQKPGAISHLRSAEVSLALKNPNSVLALLIGRYVWGKEQPRQVFANMRLQNSAEVLAFWSRAGYIVGSPQNWTLSPLLVDRIRQNIGSQATQPNTGPVQVGLYDLVAQYKRHLKRIAKTDKKAAQLRIIAPGLRLLCRKIHPNKIKLGIDAFFTNRTWPDYSVEQFEKFMASRP